MSLGCAGVLVLGEKRLAGEVAGAFDVSVRGAGDSWVATETAIAAVGADPVVPRGGAAAGAAGVAGDGAAARAAVLRDTAAEVGPDACGIVVWMGGALVKDVRGASLAVAAGGEGCCRFCSRGSARRSEDGE